MALFTAADAIELYEIVRQHYAALSDALGLPPATPAGPASPLRRDIQLLIDVANGLHSRTDEQVHQTEQALLRVRTLLLANALGAPAALPEAFWHTKAGLLVSRASWWVWMDDLITISNAAALAFGTNTQANRMRIARAIDSGMLDWLPDPSVANRQHNRRVRRSQVEWLAEMRQLPGAD